MRKMEHSVGPKPDPPKIGEMETDEAINKGMNTRTHVALGFQKKSTKSTTCDETNLPRDSDSENLKA